MPKIITPRELADRLAAKQQVLLVDVRNPDEHAFARLPESVLIPLPEFLGRVGEVDPPEGVTVVVYCHHGVRSLTGAALLERAGVKDVYSLSGGIEAWS